MKTSNKLIIAFIATPFIIMSFVDVALYTKFKKGDYVLQSSIDELKIEKLLLTEDIHSVQLSNLYHVDIVLSDSNFIEWDKSDARDIEHSIINGQLTIGLKKQFMNKDVNSYENVTIHLKDIKDIILTRCEANLLIDKKAKQDSLLTIHSNLTGSLTIGENENKRYEAKTIDSSAMGISNFQNLHITSENYVQIEDEIRIQNLQIELTKDGKLNADKCSIEKLDLQMFGNSRLDVSGDFYQRYFNKNPKKSNEEPTSLPTTL